MAWFTVYLWTNFFRMKGIFLFLFINILIICHYQGLSQNVSGKELFRSPVDFPILLSGNFGELRPDHFHSGIDIKTQGVTGIEIYSIDEGWISRISVAPNGFGNAVYITHPSGFVSVYGHLNSFELKLANFVKKIQYQRSSFSINIYPERTKFQVSRGELIGYSGNTGDSGGAHLHLEIRDAGNGNVLNPLKYFRSIKDTIIPRIYNLAVFPMDKQRINLSGSYNEIYKPVKISGKYLINKIIKVGGDFGLGIETRDFLNDSWNKCGVYSIELQIDNLPVYYHEINEFSFNESRYLNSFVDYKAWQENIRIQKSFVEPNNKLSIYKFAKDDGRIILPDYELHKGKYIVSDVSGNTTTLEFLLQKDSLLWDFYDYRFSADKKQYMSWQKTNKFETDEIKISIPFKALYDSILFKYNCLEASDSHYSSIHYIHNKYTPLHKSYSMSIKALNLPEELHNKALIAGMDNGGNMWSVGGQWDNGYISVNTRSFGIFAVTVDTLPPDIIPLDINKNNRSKNNSVIQFIIKDDLSGIKEYKASIDKKWALFEYDQKNDLISYTFDPERLSIEAEHSIELVVTDNKGNSSVYRGSFFN